VLKSINMIIFKCSKYWCV